jgi:hypothetical protein
MRSEEGKMLMAYWDQIYKYMLDYPTLIWSIPPLKYMTILMISAFLIRTILLYSDEKNQKYSHNGFQYSVHLFTYIFYVVPSIIHGAFIATDLGLAPENGYGQVFGPIYGGVAATIALFLFRFGENLICWYLGTPLWPWNPFVNKPGFEKIVAKNQRDNKKRWLAEQRRKRLEGKRYSD